MHIHGQRHKNLTFVFLCGANEKWAEEKARAFAGGGVGGGRGAAGEA
jgi:hypothetical protein